MYIPGFREKRPEQKIARYLLTLFPAIVMLGLFQPEAAAQGLLITPRRIVFEGSRRTQEINLANAGKDTAKYTITFVEIRMNNDGSFEEITKPDSGQQFASNYLRVFPRIVTLGPDESQTVKVQLTNTSKLPDGEYRSHLYFKALAKEKPKDAKKLKKMVTNLSLKLTPVFGVTIPVLVRIGSYSCEVSFAGLAIGEKEGIPVLNMTVNRAGAMSAYGTLEIEHISPEGKSTNMALVKGFSVYSPNTIRHVQIKLDKAPVNLKTGKLHIIFTAEINNRPAKPVETELPLS